MEERDSEIVPQFVDTIFFFFFLQIDEPIFLLLGNSDRLAEMLPFFKYQIILLIYLQLT